MLVSLRAKFAHSEVEVPHADLNVLLRLRRGYTGDVGDTGDKGDRGDTGDGGTPPRMPSRAVGASNASYGSFLQGDQTFTSVIGTTMSPDVGVNYCVNPMI